MWRVMAERYGDDALAEAASALADATDDDSEDEAASESEEAPDPWTDDGEYVVCLGCPEVTDDGFVSSGEDAPSGASDDDDGPPETMATKRKRADEPATDVGDE